MARRRSDIAGLAALAALGYGLYNSKKKEEEARKKPAAAETPAAKKSSYDEETVFTGPMEPKTTTPRQQPKKSASEPASEPESMAEKYSKTDTGDETPRLAKRYPKPASRPSAPDTGDETSRLARRYAAPAASRSPSREELISQIPTGGMPTVTDGERVSGSEFGRQAKTTMGALGAATGAGAAIPAVRSAMNVGMYGRGAATGAKAAQEALSAPAQKALSAPTKRLEGPSKSDLVARDRAAREAARREEMLEENARRYGLDKDAPGYEGTSRAVRESLGEGNFTLLKKGGAVKAASSKPAKPAAKGWGKARGARQAKYY